MSVDPLALGGVYVASPERNVISFSPGTLVFIKAPHPNGWEAVTRGAVSIYLYLQSSLGPTNCKKGC